jgi:hypothetical protein
MPHPWINGADGGRQAGTAIGQNQLQRSAFQSAPVQILKQGFPVRLSFALAGKVLQPNPFSI